MTSGKALNTSDKLSTWDQDPGYMVTLQKQRGNVYKHLLRRVQSVFSGNDIWMGFSAWERLQERRIVLGV